MSIYKIITKVLSNRQKEVLSKVIDRNQCVSVPKVIAGNVITLSFSLLLRLPNILKVSSLLIMILELDGRSLNT